MKSEPNTLFLYGNTILPECIPIFGLLIILLTDLTSSKRKTTLLYFFAFISLFVTAIMLLFEPKTESIITFAGSLRTDGFIRIFQFMVVLSSIICIFISIEYTERTGMAIAEPLVFLLTGTTGGMFLCCANDLVTIFVSPECLSLCSYLLCSYTRKDIRSNEAAMKYLLIGGLSSSILAYGFSWLYGLSGGETNMQRIGDAFSLNAETLNFTGVFIALVCIIIGLAFKLSLVPSHQWTPDIYEGV